MPFSHISTMRIGALVFALALSLVMLRPDNVRAGIDAAEQSVATVQRFGNAALGVLRDRMLTVEQRNRSFTTLLTSYFDIGIISRRVLGQAWEHTTSRERLHFKQVFTRFIVANYAAQLESGQLEAFKVRHATMQSKNGSLVSSEVWLPAAAPKRVDWQLIRQNRTWRIIDVTVDGVGMTKRHKDQFAAVIRRAGLPGLIRKLQEAATPTRAGT